MITKDHINNWIDLNAAGVNIKEDAYWMSSEDNLQRRLVEAKVLTDRWGVCATVFIFPSSKKDYVREKLGDKLTKWDPSLQNLKAKLKDLKTKLPALGEALEKLGKTLSTMGNGQSNLAEEMEKMFQERAANELEADMMWGARIYYMDDCPADKGMVLALDQSEEQLQSGDSSSVAVFPM
jgi:hypothetical protein